VVELAKRFTPSAIYPALVVYERADGAITRADQVKVAADAKRFAGVEDVTSQVMGAIPAEDGRALQVVVPIKVAEATEGGAHPQDRGAAVHHPGRHRRARVYVTGPAGYFADFANVFSGFDSTQLCITAVIVILLVTYRSPGLWLLLRRPEQGLLPHRARGRDRKVGGGSAVNLDILRASGHDRDLVVPLVLNAAAPRFAEAPRRVGGQAIHRSRVSRRVLPKRRGGRRFSGGR
jgi:MMPL family protein